MSVIYKDAVGLIVAVISPVYVLKVVFKVISVYVQATIFINLS